MSDMDDFKTAANVDVDFSGSSSSSRSVSNTSSMNSHTQEEKNKHEAIMVALTKNETKKVARLRTGVIIALIFAAAAMSISVYFITTNAESEEFMTQYEGASSKIMDSFDRIIDRVSSINSIGVAATIQGMQSAKEENGTARTAWPFVTLPNYQQRAATARQLSAALYISFAPLVSDDDREEWERFSVGKDKLWIEDGLKYQEELGLVDFEHNPPPLKEVLMTNYTRKQIFELDAKAQMVVDPGPGPYLPRWQASPILKKDGINENLFKNPRHGALAKACVDDKKAIFGHFENGPPGLPSNENTTTALLATLRSFVEGEIVSYLGALVVRMYLPLYDSFDADRNIVGVMMTIVHWRAYLRFILPSNANGLTVVVENTCDGFFTYELNGPEADVIGMGDWHQSSFNKYERTAIFGADQTILDGTKDGMPISTDGCLYRLHVYPSQKFVDAYVTKTPILITTAVALVFLLVLGTFFFYNTHVERRQQRILYKAVQSTAIVSSLFPEQVHDRLMGEEGNTKLTKSTNNILKSFLSGGDGINKRISPVEGTSTIADLFPHCTVLFADIAGFTAWSSSRSPDQVFFLLQTIYQGFDLMAKRRKVFKVETIGDCYLAVTGLPDPQPEHAVIMSRFAWECKHKLNEITTELEVTLGPDCNDLKMRFGLHSGPVTAGVLRGERARFQLFGDTVNTAARMESTGIADKIQISDVTAKILIESGKEQWIQPRNDLVEAKGKGKMKTYWLNRKIHESSSTADTRSSQCQSEVGLNTQECDPSKLGRLVDWIVELLMVYVKNLLAKNTGIQATKISGLSDKPTIGTSCFDEVSACIEMPEFDSKSSQINAEDIKVPEELVADIRSYISIIANMYNANPFHNFEHACHVTMSVGKLLKRIVTIDVNLEDLQDNNNKNNGVDDDMAFLLNQRTYGISSDPVSQFAIVFSALIHDVDHRGCSNSQLIQEVPEMGLKYKNKSVAEQNSLDLSWMLLMSEQFDRLRNSLFPLQSDLLHFRQVTVNTVLATDIFDKELNDLRKARWEMAFPSSYSSSSSSSTTTPTSTSISTKRATTRTRTTTKPFEDEGKDQADRKATIVIEHIIQASDVAHTMQHWQVYRKWNKLLFKEMYQAYLDGRMATDPSTFWYRGEIGFFDNYVIPLAKKLKECNVFGVSSDEYLNYAESNRDEWEQKGESILEELLHEFTCTCTNTGE